MVKKYKGIDFSADWKVVTYEGKVISASWKTLKDSKGNVTGIAQDESKSVRPLAGFNNFRHAQQASRLFGGVAVRM